MDPGLIGGLVLPILGALPDAAIIAMSGLGGTVQEAQEQVAVGMGTLAGSTVMLLTIAWAGSLVLGRCDLVMGRNGTLVAKEKTLGEYNGPWDLMRTGVTTDDQTRFNAYPMVLSSLLYLVVQVPAFFGYEQDYTAAVVGFVLTLMALAVYCVYQVISPDLQRKKMQAAHDTARRHAMVARVAHLASSSGHALVNADQSLNADAARAIFDKFDSDGNGHLDITEMKALILGLSIGMQTDITESALDEMFKDFDANSDGEVTFDEFTASLTKWCRSKLGAMSHPQTPTGAGQSVNTLTTRLANEATPLCETDTEEGMAGSDGAGGESEEEEAEEPLTESQVYQQATTKLLLGAVIIALFADPMVDAVAAFAVATDISPFMVSFVVTPFASNASELVTSLTFASRKRKKNISLTYSQVRCSDGVLTAAHPHQHHPRFLPLAPPATRLCGRARSGRSMGSHVAPGTERFPQH